MTAEERYERNEGLVYFTLNRFFGYIAQDEDWTQIGRIGLWRACCLFDDARGVSFTTYAVTSIRNFILREMRYKKNQSDVESVVVSLSAPVKDVDEKCLEDTIPDEANSIEDFERRESAKQLLNQLYGVLTDQQKKTLDTLLQCDVVFTEAAALLGITQQAVHARLKAIKRKAECLSCTDQDGSGHLDHILITSCTDI